MRWRVRLAVTFVGLSTVLVAGCSDSGGEGGSARPSGTAASPLGDAVSAKAQAAEKLKLALEESISAGEQRFGSGTKSPCATSSPLMFTAKCKAAAGAVSQVADQAMTEINGRPGFATLGSVARKLQNAKRTYNQLGCATAPTAPQTRHACLAPAAVVAQGFDDLRDGANLALAGK
ncbi:hypothetical protein [Streptomyces melanogenes]|uniref:Lipoprotein n=2 Tax=Streptomyces TaxID=1883 RepID=A0ABZ1XWQ0_9ACTN|nr:hypothetical protein [Streptomyces melanogenes]